MTQRNVIRLFLLGLPIGTVVLGAASLLIYFSKDRSPKSTGTRKEISEADLRANVNLLAKTLGERNLQKYPNLRNARSTIEGSLKAKPDNTGFSHVELQEYSVDGKDVANLIVEVPGGALSREIVIVGAHYDTAPGTPGADDNATGVAALISLAQAFSGTQNARTLRFIAFVNEEPPHFMTDNMGSMVYARRCKDRGEKIAGMLSLESLGYYTDEPDSQKLPPGLEGKVSTTGNFVAFVGFASAQTLIDQCRDAFHAADPEFPVEAAALPVIVEEAGWSDHWPFSKLEYPACMVTDTALLRYPHYHQPTDTPDKIDFARFTRVVKALEKVIKSLVNPG